MPMLEEGLSRLYWPPLVKEAVMTVQHPGYRYDMFTNFKELDAYFTAECGPDWRKQEWARYWFSQHIDSKRKDQRESNPMRSMKGPRKDIIAVEKACYEVLEQSPYISSRKLVYILRSRNVIVSHMTASKIIKRFKEEQANGETI